MRYRTRYAGGKPAWALTAETANARRPYASYTEPDKSRSAPAITMLS